jgi:Na+-translocating ferredoxin:NAD+ oxidoreductase RnfD subunit
VAAAIGSKFVFRVWFGGRRCHFLNPSNFGIALTLLLFPTTGVLPWAFTAGVDGPMKWVVPGVIVLLGFRLNLLFTRRLPLIGAWLVTFVLQALLRAVLFEENLAGALAPLTGVPLVLFTFYMITDPQTSPSRWQGQILYGSMIGWSYCVLMLMHVSYTMFYALIFTSALRGLSLWLTELQATQAERSRALARVAPPSR